MLPDHGVHAGGPECATRTTGPGTPPGTPCDEGERGGALVEFIVLVVALLVPVLYLVMSLSLVQASVFAAESASREAARVLAGDPTDLDTARAQVDLAFGDFGLPAPAEVSMGCVPAGCHGESARVSVRVSTTVPMPLVPGWVGQRGLVPVTSTSEAVVEGMRLDG
ncbi:hypothetical protein [Actinomyces provencensis]|uniref:hypothetical protein n=1 Tax=Actinomyces provencensis TaxID=1720198 RepID=UPI0009902822|nr:hypothetical protein [Actinomyces provencensis]